MQLFRWVIKWGGIPVGIAISALSIVSDIRGISEWGLPIWVWYLIGLLIIITSALGIIIGLWRENKKLRLPQEKQQWDEIRQEKVRLRKPYENRLEISKLLTQMHEQAMLYTKQQLQTTITKKKWEQIANSVGKIIPKHTIAIILFLPKLQWLARTKVAIKLVTSFLFEITGIINSYGYGSLEADKDEVYLTLYNKVKEYEIGLPAQICSEIESHILLSKMLSTMQIFELSQPVFRNIRVNPKFANKFQYLLPATHMMLSKSRGSIHESTERWLIGD